MMACTAKKGHPMGAHGHVRINQVVVIATSTINIGLAAEHRRYRKTPSRSPNGKGHLSRFHQRNDQDLIFEILITKAIADLDSTIIPVDDVVGIVNQNQDEKGIMAENESFERNHFMKNERQITMMIVRGESRRDEPHSSIQTATAPVAEANLETFRLRKTFPCARLRKKKGTGIWKTTISLFRK